MSTTTERRVTDVLHSLEKQGCTLKPTKSGYMVHFPNGQMTVVHLTSSDHRAELNFRSYVLRNGCTWPHDKKGKK